MASDLDFKKSIKLKFMPNTWKQDRIVEVSGTMYWENWNNINVNNDDDGGCEKMECEEGNMRKRVLAMISNNNATKKENPEEEEEYVIVTKVIFSKKNLAVFDCIHIKYGRFCMKLRRPYEGHVRESRTYMDIASNPKVSGFFPKLYALLQISITPASDSSSLLPENNTNNVWGGICMEMIDGHSLVDLLFVKSRPYRQDMNMVNWKRLKEEFNQKPPACPISEIAAEMAKTSGEGDDDDGGIYIRRVPGRTLDTSLVGACLEMLHRLHLAGWVHGDTHLGNFILDAERWRLYAVDLERTFYCNSENSSVQYMLDIQELVGHASGLIVSYPNGNEWNMTQVWGVTTKLHPLLRPQKRMVLDESVLHMLPVCICFIEEKEEDKECACCKSDKNVRASKSFTFISIQNFFNMSLKRMRNCVHEARKNSIRELDHVKGSLSLLRLDVEAFLVQEKSELDTIGDGKMLDCDNNDHSSSGGKKKDREFETWVQKIMYWGAFFPQWARRSEKLMRYLQLKRGNANIIYRNLQFHMPKHSSSSP